ncbi:hypothetical protein [Coralliovum pocilloporae]|uniref:hypothetical protein n=1 Tax=Coralliovum pocilloporae TaxID=3066369 RepID=UPI003307085A
MTIQNVVPTYEAAADNRGKLTIMQRLVVAALAIVAPSILLAIVFMQPWAEPKWMFLDTLTAAELSGDCCHVYYGFLSNIGILLWAGTAAVCLVAMLIFFRVDAPTDLKRFAMTACFLTGWLALDDMFLLHELVLPSLGIPQLAVIAIYGVLSLSYVGMNWRFILGQEYWILGVGFATLGLSVAVDTIMHSLLPHLVYLEDSAKLIGICCWAGFHLVTIYANSAELIETRQSHDASGRHA